MENISLAAVQKWDKFIAINMNNFAVLIAIFLFKKGYLKSSVYFRNGKNVTKQ